MTLPENYAYTINEAYITSERMPLPLEIKDILVELEVYESVERAFLTATVFLYDQNGVFESADLLGGEQVFITLTANAPDARSKRLQFRISKVEPFKGTDARQVVKLHLIDEVLFRSNLRDVNRFYRGTPSTIINKIASEFLEMPVNATNTDKDEIKVIVPHMHPVEAIEWLRDTAMSSDGYPLFVFKTLFNDNIYIRDFGELATSNTVNSNGVPFVGSTANNTSVGQNTKTIISHEYKRSKTIPDLIAAGMTGAKYNFLDTMDSTQSFNWNLSSDLVEDILKFQMNEEVRYTQQYRTTDGESFNNIQSTHHFNIGGSTPFDEGDLAYGERRTLADYKLHQKSRILKKMIGMDTINLRLMGAEFLAADGPCTVGALLDVLFPRSTITPEDKSNRNYDTERSGKYFIIAARHTFQKTDYHVTFLGGKMDKERY